MISVLDGTVHRAKPPLRGPATRSKSHNPTWIAGFENFMSKLFVISALIISDNCYGASVASEQQHNQDLRRMYKRENESSKSSLFTRMLCDFSPECIAPSTRVHCATNNTRLWHCCNGVLFLRGLQLREVSGYDLLWFTCEAMWARSCLTFTTLAVVVNAEFESLETLDD